MVKNDLYELWNSKLLLSIYGDRFCLKAPFIVDDMHVTVYDQHCWEKNNMYVGHMCSEILQTPLMWFQV